MKTTWKFDDWADIDSFEENRKNIEKAYNEFEKKWKDRTDFLEDSKILLDALNDYEKILTNYYYGGSEGYYYWLNQELNETDLQIRAKYNSIFEFITLQENKITFFKLAIGKIKKEKQEEFLRDEKLLHFKTLLTEIFENSKYMLSEKEENILGLKSNSSYSMWVRMVSSLLVKETREIEIDGKVEEKTYPELLSLMKSGNKRIRDKAAELFEDILEKYSDVSENEINAILEDHKVNDMLRGFKRPDEVRLLDDSVDINFVDSLRNRVTNKYEIPHRFYTLKSKLLKLDKIGYHERAAEYVETNKKYSWEEGSEIVKKTFLKLDPKFLEIFNELIDKNRIDVFPKKGKRMGAFCVHTSIKLPTYVLLNHTGTLDDVTTIAHELGHAINNEMIREKQGAIYFGTPKATAEVASTFMEDFVLEEILKNSNDEEKLAILVKKLDDDMASIFRQVAAYEFEFELHETYRKEGYLPKEKIGEIFKKHMSNYLGESVDCSKAENWWIYWPHIREMFYVYSYSSGLLISKAMQQKYKNDSSFIEKVKEFLASGTSEKPKNIFKKMGIDIYSEEFWDSGLKRIEELLIETEKLAKKLGKI